MHAAHGQAIDNARLFAAAVPALVVHIVWSRKLLYNTWWQKGHVYVYVSEWLGASGWCRKKRRSLRARCATVWLLCWVLRRKLVVVFCLGFPL